MSVHRVRCYKCEEAIFDFESYDKYSGDTVNPADFKPLGDYPAPERSNPMLCPLCGKPFYGQSRDGGVCLSLVGGGWWPMPPV